MTEEAPAARITPMPREVTAPGGRFLVHAMYMTMPKRIQMRRTKGWRKPAGVVYVGRPTQWGNPFSEAEYGKFHEVQTLVDAYRALITRDFKWFRENDGFSWKAGFILSHILRSNRDTEELLTPLRGMDLACWCPLDKPCHADVLLELANSR